MSNLDHFTALVKNAKTFGPYASNGEQRALKLAEAVLSNVGSLDYESVMGFLEFIRVAYDSHNAACFMIDPLPLAAQPCNEEACDAAMEKAIKEVAG